MGSEKDKTVPVIVKMAKTCGQHLNGRMLGEKNLAQVRKVLSSVPAGEIVRLDFAGVQYVTGSWINAMVVPLFHWSSEEKHNLFFVFCNTQGEWVDELSLVAEWNYQCYLVSDDPQEPTSRASLIGALDTAQSKALKAVLQIGQVTGAELERKRPQERIGATAWNNRLKDLFEKRVVRRTKQGREQIYSPVVKEIDWHG
jgi:hypothetical protein